MSDRELHYLDLLEVGELVARRKVSAVELARHQIERMAKLRHLNAFITETLELALQQAQAADAEIAAEHRRSVFHGVPIALKDVFDLKGTPTTAGMPIRRNSIAAEDATVVRRLKDAGAVILGKLNLTEGFYAEHVGPFGTPVNPWNADRWCGASSSGSAVAVAAGLTFAGLSSETGGSIRIPSSVNGVTGLKPTWGRVSRHGVFELAGNLDHVGPIARSAADAGALLEVIAGQDAADPTTSRRPVPRFLSAAEAGLAGVRIGLDMAFAADGVDLEIVAALEQFIGVMRELGADIVSVSVPDTSTIIWDWFDVCAVQVALAHEQTYPAQAAAYGSALADIIERGRAATGMDYQRVIARREAFRGHFDTLFDEVDLVVSPGLAFSVPTTDAISVWNEELISGIHRFTCPFTMSGHPVISMPGGVHSDGHSIAIQLIGPLFAEDRLIQAARAFQEATDYHRRHPFP
jgi:amidase